MKFLLVKSSQSKRRKLVSSWCKRFFERFFFFFFLHELSPCSIVLVSPPPHICPTVMNLSAMEHPSVGIFKSLSGSLGVVVGNAFAWKAVRVCECLCRIAVANVVAISRAFCAVRKTPLSFKHACARGAFYRLFPSAVLLLVPP